MLFMVIDSPRPWTAKSASSRGVRIEHSLNSHCVHRPLNFCRSPLLSSSPLAPFNELCVALVGGSAGMRNTFWHSQRTDETINTEEGRHRAPVPRKSERFVWERRNALLESPHIHSKIAYVEEPHLRLSFNSHIPGISQDSVTRSSLLGPVLSEMHLGTRVHYSYSLPGSEYSARHS
jgi:hypothetical protein